MESLQIFEKKKVDPLRDYIVNDIYNRILNIGGYIHNTSIVPDFTRDMRINMIKRSISYFEEQEDYEKCSKLMKVLNRFNCVYFNTETYKY
jgi:3-dehydroquinate dehydratase